MTRQRTHLWQDNTGKPFKNGAPGVMANTLCCGNYHSYITTRNPALVDCHGCRAKLASTTVPREKVVAIAENIRELMELKARQLGTMAEMIRWCVVALRRKTDSFTTSAQRQEINSDKAKALLYLEHLATKMENESVRSSDDQPKENPDVSGS